MDYSKLAHVVSFRSKKIISQMNKVTGSNLRERLKRLGVDQAEAAAGLGLALPTLKATLNGGHCIDTTKYVALKVLYGINPLELMFGEDYIWVMAMYPEKDSRGKVIPSDARYVLSEFEEVLIKALRLSPEDRANVFSKMASMMFKYNEYK